MTSVALIPSVSAVQTAPEYEKFRSLLVSAREKPVSPRPKFRSD